MLFLVMFKRILSLHTNSMLSFCYGHSIQLKIRMRTNSTCPKLNHVDVIQKVLGFSEREAVNSLINYADLQRLTGDELLRRLDMLQEIGLADIKESKCLVLAKHHQSTLKNRVLSMQECGFKKDKITSASIKKFLAFTHLQISTLKEMDYIEKNNDIYKNLLEHAQLPDHYMPMNDDNNIVTLKIQLLKLLLKNEIGISDYTLNHNLKIIKRLKNKSIRMIKKNIEIARNVIGISTYRISRNPFILWTDPDNTTKMIEELRELGGVDIKLCMLLYPKIIASSYENIKQILECLKEFKFTDAAIQRALYLFTLSSKNIRKRLNELEKEEFFAVSKQHPRALRLVYYYKKVKERLFHLKQLNVHPTLSTLSTSNQKYFDRYFEHGPQRQSGNDIVNYICGELESNKIAFRSKIRGFKCWRYVPTIEIAKNISLLKQNGFNNQEIYSCVHVIFYHTSKIIDELNSLNSKPGLECCKDKNGTIKKQFILPLIVYFIEKKYNFSSYSFCAINEEETHSDILLPEYK